MKNASEDTLVDTNVVVYNFDPNEAIKGPKAKAVLQQVLAARRAFLSTQVISEFYSAVTRKLRPPLSHDQAVAEIQVLSKLARVVPVSFGTLDKAFRAAKSYSMSLWDAQIFAAAVLNGATFILTEDFQHRRTIEGVTYLNPFAADFDINEILSP